MEEHKRKNKRRYLIGGAVLCILSVAGILALLLIRGIYIKRENLLMAYEKEVIPGIVCFGDSLTFGSGGNGTSYPLVLEEHLNKDRMYIPVFNMGIGGENTVTIAARAGAIPFTVEEFTIPKECVPIEITFWEETGKEIRPLYQGDTGINPCVIAGVTGRITGELDDNNRMTYFFTREEAGESVQVVRGTEVETWASTQFGDYIYIVFMGENHGWKDDIDELIQQQQAILSMQGKYQGRYIVIGLPTGTAEERRELKNALAKTYGDKFFNIRDYMSGDAVKDAGVTLSEEDKARVEAGLIPTCFLADHIHFNAEGYRLIGDKLYEQMKELGYFEELENAVEEYGKIF